MYRKQDRNQLTLDDFAMPFGGKLLADNRWVKMASLMPWDMIEDIYAAPFKDENTEGRPPIPARIAFGALYIKENENFPAGRTVEHIAENAYMQYFLGLKEFRPEPLFDPSMMTLFCKRFSKEDIARINEEIYRRTRPPREEPPKGDPPEGNDGGGNNKGVLVLDATAAPADVRFPTDVSLLNECRENTEKIIDRVWDKTDRRGHKTAYSRKRAHKRYLKFAKRRKPKKTQIRQAASEQLEYVEKNLNTLENLIKQAGENTLTDHQKRRLNTIREVAEQQKAHLADPKAPIPNRIVNLRQPHVRPIVRGKAGTPVEFGQKLAFSVVDGFTFIDVQSWDNFAEGITLIASAEKYRQRNGVYPEAILADQTYRNRDNRAFCKEKGIRLSGPRLGRPKASEVEADKEQAYRDNCDRNIVESRNGIVKRRYGLNRIMAWLPQTAETEAAMNVLCMNVAHVLRMFLRILRQWLNMSCYGNYFAPHVKC